MEDLISLLWVLAGVGAIVYNAATKARGKQHGKDRAAGPARSEAWPVMEQSKGGGSPSSARPAAPRLKAVETPDAAFLRPESSAEKPERFGSAENTENAENARQTGGDAAKEEAFDLRRAVIYSEVLKPKFDE